MDYRPNSLFRDKTITRYVTNLYLLMQLLNCNQITINSDVIQFYDNNSS